MNAIPPDFSLSSANDDTPLWSRAVVDIDAQWQALREAAAAVVQLAGVTNPALAEGDLPAGLRQAKGMRRQMIGLALEDLVAVMEAGLTALVEVYARGGDMGPPARALWQEFVRARAGLDALAPMASE